MADPRFLTATDGVRLAVYDEGRVDAPVVVCVHGYPDDHSVWDGVVAQLADRFTVVRYDVRGAGASGRPGDRDAYRLVQLSDDFRAVIDSVSPDRPVHVIAHDWGSVQAWHFASEPALRGRIASLTSISGPDLAYTEHWLGECLRGRRRIGRGLRQLGSSYYIALFKIPVLPEKVITSRLAKRAMPRHRSTANLVDGLKLYRANMLRLGGREKPRPTDVPAQVLAPTHDHYVGRAVQFEAPAPFVSDLATHTVDGGHWVVVTNPALIAELAVRLIDRVETAS